MQRAYAPGFPGSVAARTYASFWRRFGAWLIDSIVLAVAGAVIDLAIPNSVERDWSNDSGFLTFGWLGQSLVGVAYAVYFTSRGATPGKMALGIRVVDAMGNPPGLKRAILRSVFTIAWLVLMPLVIAGLQIAYEWNGTEGLHSRHRHRGGCDLRLHPVFALRLSLDALERA